MLRGKGRFWKRKDGSTVVNCGNERFLFTPKRGSGFFVTHWFTEHTSGRFRLAMYRYDYQADSRFVTGRFFVWHWGPVIIDLHTGEWRRYSYPLTERALRFADRLNAAHRLYLKTSAALDGEFWPARATDKLKACQKLFENWRDIRP